MDTLHAEARSRIQAILAAGADLTLATLRPDGYPQATTVSYVNRGLVLYAGIGLDSQKAHNVEADPRVSLTVNLPYADWGGIRGISAAATATITNGTEELARVAALMAHKFPEIRRMQEAGRAPDWGSVLVLRIEPKVISLLDYTLGFGHTELYAVPPEACAGD